MVAHFTVIAIVLIFSMASVDSTNPGFRTRITQKGIDYANQQAIAALTKDIRKVKVPDQRGHAHHVDYEVKNIQVTNFNPPSSKISLLASTGLQWTIANAGISLKADWHYKYKQGFVRISDGGSLSADVNGVSLSISFKIGEDSSGRPSISTSSCSGSISSVHVHFHGGRAFIYNLFKSFIEKAIKESLQGELCKLITKAVNEDAQKQLAKLPMMVVLARKFLLDYRLVSPPIFTAQYLETNHKGEIYWKEDQKEAPFTAPAMAESGETSHMLYLWLSDYMANSLAFAAFGHDYLHYNITPDMLPPDSRSMLNTSCAVMCIGKLIPQIGLKYPNATVKFALNATSPPALKMTPGLISLVVHGDLDMVAMLPGGHDAFLLSLNVSLQMKVTASIQGTLLIGKVEGAEMQLALIKSDVGEVQIHALQTLLNLVLNRVVIPKINEKTAKGLVLPVTGDIHFVNPKLVIQESALMVATDVSYKMEVRDLPPASSEIKMESHPLVFQHDSGLASAADFNVL